MSRSNLEVKGHGQIDGWTLSGPYFVTVNVNHVETISRIIGSFLTVQGHTKRLNVMLRWILSGP